MNNTSRRFAVDEVEGLFRGSLYFSLMYQVHAIQNAEGHFYVGISEGVEIRLVPA